MKDDIHSLEQLLEDGDDSTPIPVQGVSYREKLWRILSHHSISSYFNVWNHLDYGKACFPLKTTQEKSTMTASPIKKRSLPLLLVLILLTALLIGLSFCVTIFIWPSRSQPAEAEVDGVWGNPTEAIWVMPRKLSVASLLEDQSQEPPWGAMRKCLDTAAQKFSEEPNVLKKNARMVLQCNGTRKEFLSGKGENDIEVVWINGKVDYLIHGASTDVRVARLSSHPWPLNLTTISGVRRKLAILGASAEIQACLGKVMEEFRKEPLVVQNNAKLVVSCGIELTFISGKGQTEISVYGEDNEDGKIQYWVKATELAWWARFFKRGAT